MRRIFVLFLIALLLGAVLSGCKTFKEEPRPEDRLPVLSLGFDFDGKDYTLTAETVEAQSGGSNSISAVVAEGVNLDAAFGLLSAKSPRPLSFSHTAAVVLGHGITMQKADEIRVLLTSKNEFPLSCVTVFADSAKEFLTAKGDDNEPVGLLLQNLLRQKSETTGIGGHSTLFEISTALLQPVRIFALPAVVEGDGNFEIGELCIVSEALGAVMLSYDESLAYTLIRNVFDGGEIFFGRELIKADKTSVKLNPKTENGRLKLVFTVRAKSGAEAVAKILESTLQNSERDLFGIEGEIYKTDSKLYNTIRDDYERYFKEKIIEVRMEKE